MYNRRPWQSFNRGRGQPFRGFGVRGGGNFGPRAWRGGPPRRGMRGPRGPIGYFRGSDRGGRGKHDYNRQNNFSNSRQNNLLPVKRLTEADIGVTEYVSDHSGFNGIIKSRYADFQVSEINLQGEIAKLTDIEPPEHLKNEEIKEDEELLLSKYNLELLPMETWDTINTLALCPEPISERVEVDVTGMTKEHRTKIHEAVKKAFGTAIVGSTVTVNDQKIVRFEKFRKGVIIDDRVKWLWPGEYLHFILHKENCDTMEAATRIAEKLKFNANKPQVMGYAGTKDRRAKTTQWFSLRKVEPRRLQKACEELRDIHVGNYSFSDGHIKLGMLSGNKFRIVLRNVTSDDEIVNKACEDLKTKGFINYYGLQRFGTRQTMPTYDIGLKLLQGNFREAINCILDIRDGPLCYALLRYKETGNAAQAHNMLRNYGKTRTTIEARLLKALARDPNDLVGALAQLSRNTRLLYIHSYQSFVWNKCVSERIKRFGLDLAVGDIVLLEAPEGFEEAVDKTIIDQEFNEEESQEDETKPQEDESKAQEDKTKSQEDETKPQEDEATPQEDETIPMEEETKCQENETKPQEDKSNGESIKSKLQESESKSVESTPKPQESLHQDDVNKGENTSQSVPDAATKIKIKVLRQEDIDTGKYSLFDILLPLPGHSVKYPPNMKEYYQEVLAKDNMSLEMKHKIKSYRLSGTYRRVFVKPSELEWQLVRYDDPHGDLLLSDYDELMEREITAIVPDGKYKALILTMSLPASCYATMALRELLRCDTSGKSQSNLNNYYLPATTENDGKTKEAEKRKTEGEPDDESESKKSKQDYIYAY